MQIKRVTHRVLLENLSTGAPQVVVARCSVVSVTGRGDLVATSGDLLAGKSPHKMSTESDVEINIGANSQVGQRHCIIVFGAV